MAGGMNKATGLAWNGIRLICLLAILPALVCYAGEMPRESSQSARQNMDAEQQPSASYQKDREVLVDVYGKRRDCGFNLLARIAAINQCDRCPRTKARLHMAANYLHSLSLSEENTTATAQYDVAQSYLFSQCPKMNTGGSTDTETILTTQSSLTEVDMLESLPKQTLSRILQAHQSFAKEAELAKSTLLDLLFPELQQKCCLAPQGCTHQDIAEHCQ